MRLHADLRGELRTSTREASARLVSFVGFPRYAYPCIDGTDACSSFSTCIWFALDRIVPSPRHPPGRPLGYVSLRRPDTSEARLGEIGWDLRTCGRRGSMDLDPPAFEREIEAPPLVAAEDGTAFSLTVLCVRQHYPPPNRLLLPSPAEDRGIAPCLPLRLSSSFPSVGSIVRLPPWGVGPRPR